MNQKAHDMLVAAPLFANLDVQARTRIIDCGKRLVLDPGLSLWRQGEAPELLVTVIDGQIKETMIDAQGGQKTLHYLRSGNLLGCASLFGNYPHSSTATATERTELLYWTAGCFNALMHDHPDLAVNALGIVGRHTESLLRRLHEATSENADRRIARIVLRLAAVGELGVRDAPIELILSRQELAELSDTTLFTVSRTISAWNRMEIVRAGRGRLTVIDLGRLAGLAGASTAS